LKIAERKALVEPKKKKEVQTIITSGLRRSRENSKDPKEVTKEKLHVSHVLGNDPI
jgi:hypothetical protein